MAVISLDRQPIPDSFCAHDRFLVEKTELVLVDGIQLERWCRDPQRKVNEFLLDLKRPYALQNPRAGCKLEVAFGYPFIDYAPIPDNFGFGPGKFNWAVKLFSFLLRDNNEVRCEIDFAV